MIYFHKTLSRIRVDINRTSPMNVGGALLLSTCPSVHPFVCLSSFQSLSKYFFQISFMDYFYQTLAKVQILVLFDQMAAACGFALVDALTYHPPSSLFHIWTTFIKILFMSEYGICPIDYNQK